MASTNENKIYNEYGSLMLFNKVQKKDIDLLMTLICRGQNQYLQLLREVVKDDMSLIKLFDASIISTGASILRFFFNIKITTGIPVLVNKLLGKPITASI